MIKRQQQPRNDSFHLATTMTELSSFITNLTHQCDSRLMHPSLVHSPMSGASSAHSHPFATSRQKVVIFCVGNSIFPNKVPLQRAILGHQPRLVGQLVQSTQHRYGMSPTIHASFICMRAKECFKPCHNNANDDADAGNHIVAVHRHSAATLRTVTITTAQSSCQMVL